MTRKQLTRMADQGARLDAGHDLAEELAQLELAARKLDAVLTAEPTRFEASRKQQDDTDDDDLELAQKLGVMHLDQGKKRKKRGRKKKSAELKTAEEKAVQEKAVQGKAVQEKAVQEKAVQEKAVQEKAVQKKTAQGNPAEEKEAARQQEIREMAQKMADEILKKMGVLNIYKDLNSTHATQETEAASRETAPKQTPETESVSKKGKKKMYRDKLVRDWNDYFGDGTLEDWQRLCRDLDLSGDLSSKTKCRNAIRGVHVNIRQFLDAQHRPEDVIFFKNDWKLASWTANKRLRVPLDFVPRGVPLRSLMRELSRC